MCAADLLRIIPPYHVKFFNFISGEAVTSLHVRVLECVDCSR